MRHLVSRSDSMADQSYQPTTNQPATFTFFAVPNGRNMSTYQGMCGGACQGGAGAPVIPKPESQLSSSMRTNVLGDALVYQHQVTTGKKQFASATDYMRYKKARILAGTPLCVAGRPPQSAIITRLIETGCQACQPVCPVSTVFENTPFGGSIPISSYDDFQNEINGWYGTPTPLPPIPGDYGLDSFYGLIYPPYCNSTSQTITVRDNTGDIVPTEFTDLGVMPDGPLPGGGVIIFYPLSFNIVTYSVTLTASNSCSSSTGPVFIVGDPGGRSAKTPTHMSTLMEKFAAIKK